ncbi:hypothetical protein B0H66DRAFT_530359 [Apodospora peruviana]|uniref:Uncharacterized protein n=1 Tax=Apodospora peruviana TaxID=516989 RepID=A0AAE0IJW3_9PEZI|nr:hypothetical protein B0H66DRAFT_530359 [Apodospora peruviana]
MTVTTSTPQPIPRLAEPLEVDANKNSSSTTGDSASRAGEGSEDKKSKKRSSFFGAFSKKKTDDSSTKSPPLAPKSEPSVNSAAAAAERRSGAASPVIVEQYPHFMPSSPGRALSSSPRLSSPAGSQIFERDVQESAAVLPNSPAIPSHITTENYIPPVLDASSEAITDDHLDPDSVEIITHTGHQPAAVTVTGVQGSGHFGGSGGDLSSSWVDELAAFASDSETKLAGGETTSNYGSLDTTDVRRLSFISFADVVQSEQAAAGNSFGQAGSRDSMHGLPAGLTSLGAALGHRSPSPIRSPVSSAGGGPGTSPPTSKSGSVKGLELSPARKPLSPTATGGFGSFGSGPASPTGTTAGGGHVSGELAIETMTQALRRTGSGDLGVRSLPTSPI